MKKKVVIVGAGWAGLSAALHLADSNRDIIVLEASPQAGGRARTVAFEQFAVDNGQHVLMGAYHHFLTLVKKLQLKEQQILERQPFGWHFHHQKGSLKFQLPFNASPAQWITSLLSAKGFSLQDKFVFGQFFRQLRQKECRLTPEMTVEALLLSNNQTLNLIKNFWAPLTLAALSTPIGNACADVFIQVLMHAFFDKQSSDFLFPKKDLSAIFADKSVDFLKAKGIKTLTNQRAINLQFQAGQTFKLDTVKHSFEAEAVILATPFQTTAQLLKSFSSCSALHHQLNRFSHQSITTTYFYFDQAVNLPYPMIGLDQPMAQWCFDRKFADQSQLLSVVLTGKGAQRHMNHAEIQTTLLKEIQAFFPALDNPLAARVICEKRAAYLCTPGIDSWRPSNKTPLPGLFLAGDYTEPGYPASLEAAVKSGGGAANLLLLEN